MWILGFMEIFRYQLENLAYPQALSEPGSGDFGLMKTFQEALGRHIQIVRNNLGPTEKRSNTK